MFSVHCPGHGTEILLPTRCIERLRNTDVGIEVSWRCVCGSHGSFMTGARRRRPASLV